MVDQARSRLLSKNKREKDFHGFSRIFTHKRIRRVWSYMVKTSKKLTYHKQDRIKTYDVYKCYFCKYEQARHNLKRHILRSWERRDPSHVVKTGKCSMPSGLTRNKKSHTPKVYNPSIGPTSKNKILQRSKNNKKSSGGYGTTSETSLCMQMTSKVVTYNSQTRSMYKCIFCDYEGTRLSLIHI